MDFNSLKKKKKKNNNNNNNNVIYSSNKGHFTHEPRAVTL